MRAEDLLSLSDVSEMVLSGSATTKMVFPPVPVKDWVIDTWDDELTDKEEMI
jgi:hypothetical protein